MLDPLLLYTAYDSFMVIIKMYIKICLNIYVMVMRIQNVGNVLSINHILALPSALCRQNVSY